MASTLTIHSIRWGAGRLADRMKLVAEELNALDGALGDGDLGVTLVRATDRLVEGLPALPGDVGLALFQCAQAFTGVYGSTYGTLLATGLMAAARQTRGRTEVPWTEMPSLLGAAVDAMSKRGKSALGDKTVLDAVEAVRQRAVGLEDPEALASAAVKAVEDALTAFRDRPFQQGRARIFGAKGIGRDDPGMVAFQRILQSLLPAADPL